MTKTAKKKAAAPKGRPPRLTIDPEFSEWLPEPTAEEEERLQRSLKEHGCRHPLIVWEHDGRLILLDGHRRHRWCTQLRIDYEVDRLLTPQTREQALLWMIENQLERRNLDPLHASALRGKERNLRNPGPGKPRQIDVVMTKEKLAEKHGVSPSTIDRDSQLATSIDIVRKTCGDSAQHALLKSGLYRYEINLIADQPAATQRTLLESLSNSGPDAMRKDLRRVRRQTDETDWDEELDRERLRCRATINRFPTARLQDLQDLYRVASQIVDAVAAGREEADG